MHASVQNQNVRALPAGEIIFVGAICLVYAGLAAWFAATQSIWIDETTQLSGMTLNPIQQTRWLAGIDSKLFVVPDDRMPPLSYWLGWGWSSVFALSEDSMRWLGIVCVTSGIPGLWLAARRIGGTVGAGVIAVAFALSANVISVGGEIRAYPIFVMLSCWTCWAFVAFLQADDQRGRRAAILWVLAILAAYVHFFGAVMAGSVWLSAAVVRLARRRNPLLEIACGLLAGLSFAGLAPFVLAALRMSSGPSESTEGAGGLGRDVVRLCYRLVAHPASSVYTLCLAALLGGAFLMAAVAMLRGMWEVSGEKDSPSVRWEVVGIELVLALGITLATAAAYASKSFDALQPSYNIWLVPFFLTLLSAGFVNLSMPWTRTILAIAAGLFLFGSLLSAWTISRHRLLFSHGPSEWIFAAIDQSPSPVAVIHEKSGAWGFAYFPIAYKYGDRVEQWLKSDSGEIERITAEGSTPLELGEADPWLRKPQLWIRTDSLGAQDLARLVNEAVPEAEQENEPDSLWPRDEEREFNSFVRSRMRMVDPISSPAERIAVPPAATD